MAKEFDDPEDSIFVERTLTQTVDRAELGYADEWQFLIRKRSTTREQELVYYTATDDVGTAEFISEYKNIVDAYLAANPSIPLKREQVFHKEDIHANQSHSAGKHYSYASVIDDPKAFHRDTPEALLQAVVIVRGDATSEGELIRGVTVPWFEVIEALERDEQFLYKIHWRTLEELIAGAYERAGWDEVILTPRSGDLGRDVIATKAGIGSIRIFDQVKAFAPNHKVTANDVRALLGVLTVQTNVSKGIITTTSGFAPGIFEEAEKFMPYRLELKDGPALKKWLIELARQKSSERLL